MDEAMYQKYTAACREWIDYIRPIATKKFTEYKLKSGKIYYRFDYLSVNVSEYNNNFDKKDENIKSIFKRLALKLHPDKCNNTFSTQLFAILSKHYSLNNIHILTSIDVLIDDLLATQDTIMDTIISNLSIDGRWENVEKMLAVASTNEIKMDILTSQYKDEPDDSIKIDFLSTDAYQFFINQKTGEAKINKNYYTEDELIAKIKTTEDCKFYNYYAANYIHIKRIYQACVDRLLCEKSKLLLENKELKDKIAMITVRK